MPGASGRRRGRRRANRCWTRWREDVELGVSPRAAVPVEGFPYLADLAWMMRKAEVMMKMG